MAAERVTQEQIVEALKQVRDPDSNQDVMALGFVRNVALGSDGVHVTFELPADVATDALRRALRTQATAALSALNGIDDVSVEFGVQPKPRATSDLPGVKHCIAVGAGKGGVGKSTIAALLAVGLQRQGARVGLLDADVYGPSLPKITGTEALTPRADQETGMIYPPEFNGIRIMSMGYLLPTNQAVVWRGPMAQKYVKEFLDRGVWGELDYLIVDLPPGTGDIPLTLAQSIPLTGAVVVCTPQDVALLDATRAVRMYEKLNVPTLGMVENMSYYHCPECGHRDEIFGHGGVERAVEELGVAFLGRVPLNVKIRLAGDGGQPFDLVEGLDERSGGEVKQVIEKVNAAIAERARRRSPLPQLKISS